jgi:hypothetical protein
MANKRIDVDAEIDRVRLKEQVGDPASPSAGYTWLYTKGTGLFLKQGDETIVGPFGAGGGADILEIQVFT